MRITLPRKDYQTQQNNALHASGLGIVRLGIHTSLGIVRLGIPEVPSVRRGIKY